MYGFKFCKLSIGRKWMMVKFFLAKGLFKTVGFGSAPFWEDAEVESIVKPALAIRDVFNANKGEVNPRLLDVLVFATQELYEKLKVFIFKF